MKNRLHKHIWSKQYHGIFNGPVRVCLNSACGAIHCASGHIIYIRERVSTTPKETKL